MNSEFVSLLEDQDYSNLWNFIKNKIGIHYVDADGPLLYHLCIYDLDISFIQKVIDHGADVNQHNEFNESVLECAVLAEVNEIYIDLLIREGARISCNVLQALSRCKKASIYDLFRKYRPDINGDTLVSDADTLFYRCCLYDNHVIVEAILKHHVPNVNFLYEYNINYDICTHSIDVVDVLIKYQILPSRSKRVRLC